MRAALKSAGIGLVVALSCLGGASPALASHSQISILQDDPQLFNSPSSTLQEMRHLGVDMVRVSMRWSVIAPSPNSRRRPHFNAANSNAYPSGAWAPYDTIARDARADGIQVMFVPSGFAPLWAQGSNPGRYGGSYNSNFAFEPSDSQFAQFVRAAGSRYSGGFTPPGSHSPIPRVSAWELWNEPNFGEDLSPQGIDGSSVLYAPVMYRGLADAGWGALHATGHGRDTILIGALAARGSQIVGFKRFGLPGLYGETKPLVFIRELYCLNPRYHHYLGVAAAVRGCPTTTAGYRSFRARNPALFSSSGWSDHPYPVNQPPNRAFSGDPSYTDFSELPRMAQTLDRIQRVYHSGKRFSIWNTEYGYITDPPNAGQPVGGCRCHYVSPDLAGYYLNWAEYLSWHNPRIASTMQYLLYDPNPTVGTPEYGGFASGLIYYPTVMGGQAKSSYYDFRLPVFMPRTTAGAGKTLEVWGDVRPAPFAAQDVRQAQYAQIQFSPGSSNSWRTVRTFKVTDPHGYFDTHIAFPSSGQVRVAYTYPALDLGLYPPAGGGYTEPLVPPVNSRSVGITIH